MTLENVFYVYRHFAEVYQYNKDLTIDDFNDHLPLSEFEFLRECRREDEKKSISMFTEALRPFRSTSSIPLTSGSGILPTDFYYDKLVLSGTRGAEKVTDEELRERLRNSITAPSADWPVYMIENTTIKVWPVTITTVDLTYIKKNLQAAQPKLAFSLSNGINSYDSGNSIALLWNEENYIDIIRHLLKLIGISVNNLEIAQFVDQQQNMDT